MSKMFMGNSNLHKAKKAKNDEFYTLLATVEEEVEVYLEVNPDLFRGKKVFLPCDDYRMSMFVKYFTDNFERLGLSKLTSVGFVDGGAGVCLAKDMAGEVKIETKEDGSFHSKQSCYIRDDSDFIITNPPFSLFRDFVDWVEEGRKINHELKYLVLGNMNAITYKNVFPLIKNNQMWLGKHNGGKSYNMPCGGVKKLGNTCWFTNILHKGVDEFIPITEEYTSFRYPTYDNYDAIEVSRTKDIPRYDGVMGVPISFLTRYNPKQFEIVGLTDGSDRHGFSPSKRYIGAIQHNKDNSKVNGGKANTRACIVNNYASGVYYTADNCEGRLVIVYARVLIKHK